MLVLFQRCLCWSILEGSLTRLVHAALEQKLEAAGSEAEALHKEANRKLPGAGKLKSAIAERERKMAALQTRIHEIEDTIFAAFSKKVNLCWLMVIFVASLRVAVLHGRCGPASL